MTSTQEKQPNSAAKRLNSRPCDACAIRRVRCDVQKNADGVCTNCKNHNVQCTNIRIRHKSGPKKIKQKTRESINNLITDSTTNSNRDDPNRYSGPHKTYTLNQLIPFLQIYQTWFYCIWPILSVAHLTSRMNTKAQPTDEPLSINDSTMAEQYALSCSVCAVISRHRQFLKSAGDTLNWGSYPTPHEYAEEARRVIYEYELRATASMEILLMNYFLHSYYSNIPNGAQRGLVYLREAISIAHVLKLHDPATYVGKSGAEAHRSRKIYYQLLVTERFVSFECGVPVLLEPTIPIPSQEDEEYPDLLLGFTELAQVFAVTDKEFFQELHTKVLSSQRNEHATMFQYSKISLLQDFIQTQPLNVKRQWIYQLQKKLDRKIENEQQLMDSQKVNILVSKVWFQSIAWLISAENMLINPNGLPSIDDCFSASYPLKITNEFLSSTKGLPDFAFESNGPGVSMKLLEVADSLLSFTMMSNNEAESALAFEQMNTVFNLIVRFKNDMELPHNLFHKIGNVLNSRRSLCSITELPPTPSAIDEIRELNNQRGMDRNGAKISELRDDESNDKNVTNDLLSLVPLTTSSVLPNIEDPINASELVRDLSGSNLRSLLNLDLGTPGSITNSFSFSPFLGQVPSNLNSPFNYSSGTLSQDI